MKKITLLILLSLSLFTWQELFSQTSPDYTGGLKVKLNDEGSKYFRLITWAQMQANYNDEVPENESNTSFNLRRARLLMYAQINDKFLILTHFGLNNLTNASLSPVGKGDGAQLFFHDVWAQYSINKKHAVGGGLHYWNGISRLNNQSTLNMLPLDNNRQSWSTLGLSDQFARHLGVYAKGAFGKLQYRVSINDALGNGLDARDPSQAAAVYGGNRLLGSANAGKVFAGYFDYHIFDQESNFLPYKVGTYLGAKKILNVGAGFFAHPNGSAIVNNDLEVEGEDVLIFAADVFYDAPLGEDGNAISAYATFQSNDYGTDYLFSAYGTGSMLYGHLGYAFAREVAGAKLQPYVSFASNSYDAVDDNRNIFAIGANAYLSGNNSKLSLEYNNQSFGEFEQGTISLQAMIYL